MSATGFDADDHWERGHRAVRRARLKQAVPIVVASLAVCGLTVWAFQDTGEVEPESDDQVTTLEDPVTTLEDGSVPSSTTSVTRPPPPPRPLPPLPIPTLPPVPGASTTTTLWLGPPTTVPS